MWMNVFFTSHTNLAFLKGCVKSPYPFFKGLFTSKGAHPSFKGLFKGPYPFFKHLFKGPYPLVRAF